MAEEAYNAVRYSTVAILVTYQGRKGIHLHGKNPASVCLSIEKGIFSYIVQGVGCCLDMLLGFGAGVLSVQLRLSVKEISHIGCADNIARYTVGNLASPARRSTTLRNLLDFGF